MNFGPHTKKFRSVNFGPLQTLIANISGKAEDIQNRPALQTMAIPPAFNEERSGELWSNNDLELHVSLDPLKCTFLADYISAHRGCCAPKILHALEIEQALTAHARSETGVPPKNSNRQKFKIWKAGPIKFGRAKKTSKFRRDFWQLSTLIANIPGTGFHVKNLTRSWTTITPATLEKRNLVNFGPHTKKL